MALVWNPRDVSESRLQTCRSSRHKSPIDEKNYHLWQIMILKTAIKPAESRTTHSFVTEELSSRTWSDFDRLFSEYNGV